jgi:hypothetical protein
MSDGADAGPSKGDCAGLENGAGVGLLDRRAYAGFPIELGQVF